MADYSETDFGVDANAIWSQVADILQENNVTASEPIKALFVLGSIVGLAARAIDGANGTDEAIDSIVQVARQVYEQAKVSPDVGIG